MHRILFLALSFQGLSTPMAHAYDVAPAGFTSCQPAITAINEIPGDADTDLLLPVKPVPRQAGADFTVSLTDPAYRPWALGITGAASGQNDMEVQHRLDTIGGLVLLQRHTDFLTHAYLFVPNEADTACWHSPPMPLPNEELPQVVPPPKT